MDGAHASSARAPRQVEALAKSRFHDEKVLEMTGLMNSKDLATYLGVPLQTIYKWRTTGGGPHAIRLGRALHWRVAEVERWLDENTESDSRPGLGR